MRVAHGIRTIETIRQVAPHLDAKKEADLFDAGEVVDTAGVVAINGASLLLASLPQDAWAIVTSGNPELARARLTTSGLPIPRVLVTAGDVRQGKPAPEPYLVGAKRLGLEARKCVVLEDAPAGVRAGKTAGMRVIGITSTHTRQMLIENGADFVVDRLRDLTIRETGAGHRLGIHLG